LTPGPLALILVALASRFPDWVEAWYGRGVYPVIAWFWSQTTGRLPFHFGELLVMATSLLLVLFVVRGIVRLFRNSETFPRRLFWQRLGRSLLGLGAIASFACAAFFLLWGLNYQRRTWSENSGMVTQAVAPANLATLVDYLAENAHEARLQLPENADGTSRPLVGTWGDAAQLKAIDAAYTNLHKKYPVMMGALAPPKPSIAPRLFSTFGVAGVFSPFTGEPLLNSGPACWSLPFSAAHEAAHLRGWAREDEANFLAFLVLHDSPDPSFRYSAFFSAYLYAATELYKSGWTDENYWKAKRAILGPGASRDHKASNAYWQSFQGTLADAGSKINDTYLKSQGQLDGIRSYGRIVDLLLAWYNRDSVH